MYAHQKQLYKMTLDPQWKQLKGLPFNKQLNTLLSLKQEIDCRTIIS